MTTVACPAGRARRPSALRLAAAAFWLAALPVADAAAHVRTPDYTRLDRKPQDSVPKPEGLDGFAHRPPPQEVPAASGETCAFGRGTSPSAAAVLPAGPVLGVPPLAEVGLHEVAATDAASREMLSLLDSFPGGAESVRVALGTAPDGGPCPLAVSVTAEDGAAQTFWRYAPEDEPAGWFDEDGRRLGGPALAPPRPGARLSSPFGPRRYYGRLSGGGFHNGIDYESRIGQPILAAADGVVELRGTHFEYGLTVKIRHAAQFTTLYAHMSRFAPDVAVGSRVRQGQVIGYVGMTGRSTGAHLHFSTIVHGTFTDPAPYLSDRGKRALKPRALAGFRQWQEQVRSAVEEVRGRQRPAGPIQDADWTSRI
ncbi:MAG: M23 family metallopeptidase [Pseudomonadota bacterium]